MDLCRLAAPRNVLPIDEVGLRAWAGVSRWLASVDVFLDDPLELTAEGRRLISSPVVPSGRLLVDLVASRDDLFLFGEADKSDVSDGNEVRTLGDPGFASVLLRLLLADVAAMWDVERCPRIDLVRPVSIPVDRML
jgi:hypothetical protein